MKILLYLPVLLCFFIYPQVFSYDSLDSFLSSKDSKSCVISSDWCNSFIMKEWQIYGSTWLSCSNYKVDWKCNSYKPTFDIKKVTDIDEINKEKEKTKNKIISNQESVFSTTSSFALSREQYLKNFIWPKYSKFISKFVYNINRKLSKKTPTQRNNFIINFTNKINDKREEIKNSKYKDSVKNKLDAILEYLLLKLK